MFRTKSSGVVSFNSELSTVKSETTANVQTTEIFYASNDTQTSRTRTIGIQTVNEEKANAQVDYDKLAVFLKRVTPGILEALDEAYGTNAFNDYDPNVKEASAISVKLLKKIKLPMGPDDQIKVSDLSWSTVGGILAVGLSHIYHGAWCDHLSTIQLYNFMTEDNFTYAPTKTLETTGCVTTLCYHPTEPSILAAGLSNWEVFVWNLRNSVRPMHVCTHSDSVSQVSWKPRSVNDVSLLLSSSRDGYILIHRLTANFMTAQLFKRFKIVKERNPVENARPRSATGTRERAAEAGLWITSFDFCPQFPSIFIVGTLCGGIYKCSLDSVTPIEGNASLIDPVIDEYERHGGGVTCIKCSPLRNLFVSSALDKEIRIYNLDEHVNHQIISVDDTIVGLAWMIGNRDVFAAYGAGSSVKFYNVRNGKPVTYAKLRMTRKQKISSLCVNSKRDILAIGSTRANIEIWKFPRHLF
ncbi:PREDICTED: WD repeat-containing protein 34-like [Dinoponera quadriceps]|uniref:WD repeat-containing protein 34-like n=1 Tax=Dinoponera quadriceps TaxID=609295 RepID=A0A6P3Y8W0_DINQU|nr:PREDICTED: WD repeat-containing protein 34-like [Dinoponera quadriceps]XP_014486823.1 PREDICTED: WD repeat-containing protein 34-like [Dinoponera quadriceps]XP_014486824.1 PREDICTED: WD repeat-containing protein 34-like [Dinoponera quadriceps]